jgi:hypothetical protein
LAPKPELGVFSEAGKCFRERFRHVLPGGHRQKRCLATDHPSS